MHSEVKIISCDLKCFSHSAAQFSTETACRWLRIQTSADGFVERIYKTPGFSNILGYVSYPKKDSSGQYYDTDITGLAGVEKSFNTQLSGQNGTLLVEQNALGKTVSEGSSIPAQNGQDLTLSIDSRVQMAMYTAVQQLADRIPFKGGAGIIMNAQTGEILALVSYPTFDSNVMSSGGPSSTIAGYSTDTREPYLDRQCRDCIRQVPS